LYTTGQILDVMVQAICVEIISSKISLEGAVGLRICRMTADCMQPEQKLGTAPMNLVLFSGPLQSTW